MGLAGEVLHGRKRWFLYPRDDARTPSEIVPLTPMHPSCNGYLLCIPRLCPQMPYPVHDRAIQVLYFPTWWVHAVRI